ncbi:MAG TPA: SRPBCC domain-containing protein [Pseudonocardia sp.]
MTIIAPGQDYEARVTIDAPPEAVFAALTTLDGLAAWWAPVTGDGATGGELRFVFSFDVPLRMRVKEAREASLVQWTCEECAWLPDWVGTTISFTLTARAGGGCDLVFRHHGLTPRLECFQDCKSGWDHFLPSLRAYVETGEGHPTGSAADVERRARRAAAVTLPRLSPQHP